MNFEDTREFAKSLDQTDPLRGFRSEFYMPKTGEDSEAIYLCGNSLGLQPKNCRSYLELEMDKWARHGVKGHFSGDFPWMPYHEFLRDQASELVGASTNEVVCMNSLTVNLHLMMVSFYQPSVKRHKILLEQHAFPSDRYAVESQLRFHGYDPNDAMIELKLDPAQATWGAESWEEVLLEQGDRIALVLIPGVQYYSGQVADIERITALAKEKGCMVGVDLAHAAGNVELRLNEWEVDFAVWCHYKYLNSGPGAVAGCFVHQKHAKTQLPRLCGWWGHKKESRFEMPKEFQAELGADAWQLSNPPILALAPIRASYDIFKAAGGMVPLRKKSIQLSSFLDFLLTERLSKQISLIGPRESKERGCQLSLRVDARASVSGREVFKRLDGLGVICDWREPDVIRVAPVPLYNSYDDVYRFVDCLEESLNCEEK